MHNICLYTQLYIRTLTHTHTHTHIHTNTHTYTIHYKKHNTICFNEQCNNSLYCIIVLRKHK